MVGVMVRAETTDKIFICGLQLPDMTITVDGIAAFPRGLIVKIEIDKRLEQLQVVILSNSLNTVTGGKRLDCTQTGPLIVEVIYD